MDGGVLFSVGYIWNLSDTLFESDRIVTNLFVTNETLSDND